MEYGTWIHHVHHLHTNQVLSLNVDCFLYLFTSVDLTEILQHFDMIIPDRVMGSVFDILEVLEETCAEIITAHSSPL